MVARHPYKKYSFHIHITYNNLVSAFPTKNKNIVCLLYYDVRHVGLFCLSAATHRILTRCIFLKRISHFIFIFVSPWYSWASSICWFHSRFLFVISDIVSADWEFQQCNCRTKSPKCYSLLFVYSSCLAFPLISLMPQNNLSQNCLHWMYCFSARVCVCESNFDGNK